VTDTLTGALQRAADIYRMVVGIDNPYWTKIQEGLVAEAVRPQHPNLWQPGYLEDRMTRRLLVDEFCWTITNPLTVAFVAEHAGSRLLDPMAGTGYWVYLLRQLGIIALASDAHPPDRDMNRWHSQVTHCRVGSSTGTAAVARNGPGRTLLLSWPPYGTRDGADILAAYPGNRVIFIGCVKCTGDARMHEALAQRWVEVARHVPTRYDGIDDEVVVYDRRQSAVAA
jgi:hypothetical protein